MNFSLFCLILFGIQPPME
ncbi:unnamed protein product [Cuscuta epithymum]|uniref:Uncharacterized protein n=1 Tax=Cuscuta epithymum TaxID=186058 RepID=A0AAV0F6B5_9ASTE|nr:unnamed protein product [Cuscuta epithymum]